MKPESDEKKRKAGSTPPGAVLIVAAIIIFGIMFVFLYFENINPDWLRTTS